MIAGFCPKERQRETQEHSCKLQEKPKFTRDLQIIAVDMTAV